MTDLLRKRVSTGIERRTLASGMYSYRSCFGNRSKSFSNLKEAQQWRKMQIAKSERREEVPNHSNAKRAEIKTIKKEIKLTLTNAQLDAAIAAYLWEVNQQRRDATLYLGRIKFPKPVMPKSLATAFSVPVQRAHASLLRLSELGIATCRRVHDRNSGKDVGAWSINEGSLVRYLLAEISKEKQFKEAAR